MGKKSDNMAWWKGMTIECGKENIMCETLYDVLNELCRVPERPISAPMRMPISGIYKIKGVGDVLAGRVEQGVVKPGEEVVFLPTHTAFFEIERDGAVQLPAAAAIGVRHFQELRGPLPRCVHGRKRGGDAWQGHFLRAQGRCSWWRWRQEEVRRMLLRNVITMM